MTYPATLWACHSRDYPNGCSNYRYLEVGREPGPCGSVAMVGVGEFSHMVTCHAPMDAIGEFLLDA